MKRLAILGVTILLLACAVRLPAALAAPESAIGTLNATLSAENGWYSNSGLGVFAAESLRSALGADAAAVPNGALGHNLIRGEITAEDLNSAFPDSELYTTVTMTYAQLWALMETSVQSVVLDELQALDAEASAASTFLQIAGFTMQYDLSAPIGERLMWLKADGQATERTDAVSTLTVALPSSYAGPYQRVGTDSVTLAEAAAQYLAAAGTVGSMDTGSIKVVGTTSIRLIDSIPVYVIVLLIAACVLLRLPQYLKMRQEEYPEHDTYKYHHSRRGDEDYD